MTIPIVHQIPRSIRLPRRQFAAIVDAAFVGVFAGALAAAVVEPACALQAGIAAAVVLVVLAVRHV